VKLFGLVEPHNTGITVGPDGRIFATAQPLANGVLANSIQRWTPPNVVPDSLPAPSVTTLSSPTSDPNGLLYVADAGAEHILKLSPDDLSSYVQIGGPGDGKGQFADLHGVAVDNQCSLYISDGGNSRVQVLSYATGCN
jgi:streptogramin lyase